MTRQKRIGILIVMVVFGMIIGTALGEAIAVLLPEGVVKEFFLRSVLASIGPGTLNLVAFSITFGMSFKVNVMAVLGMILAAYLFRWY
jgi:uncharacterized membrane protein